MRWQWGDLNARSRGMATHLMNRAQLERLAQLRDLAAVREQLARGRVLVPESLSVADPTLLDRAARRPAAAAFSILARWAGRRRSALAVIFEDEERRGIRRLLRGAVQGAAAEHRMAGLIPTPSLPERAFWELARQPDTRSVAALLAAWRHPYAEALLPEAAQTHPNLLLLEAAVNRKFAQRAIDGARKGGKWLARYAQQVIDLENAWTVVLLVGQQDVDPDQLFIEGGGLLRRATFDRAVANDLPGAVTLLEGAFAGTPLAAILRTALEEPTRLEPAVLRYQISHQRRAARLEPLSPAPLIEFVLRVRAQVLDLRLVIWGVALGAPVTVITADLVTPP